MYYTKEAASPIFRKKWNGYEFVDGLHTWPASIFRTRNHCKSGETSVQVYRVSIKSLYNLKKLLKN